MLQREYCTLSKCELETLGDGKCGVGICTLEYMPVCATCNGERRTFGNACAAHNAGQ